MKIVTIENIMQTSINMKNNSVFILQGNPLMRFARYYIDTTKNRLGFWRIDWWNTFGEDRW